jgi:hypothetical protein
MGITAVFNVSGVDKQKFEQHIKGGHAATYLDWSRTWNQGERVVLPRAYVMTYNIAA